MAARNEYTETVRDLQALIRKENDAARREALGNDLIRMSKDLEEERAKVVHIAVLSEKVAGLTRLVWGLLVVIVLEVAYTAMKH